MKAIISLIALILLTSFFSAFPVEACWIGLSAEELVEQADLIVIGEIKGISGTDRQRVSG